MTHARLLFACAALLAASPASAETRIFLLENSGGYGVDTCLANGEPCGEALASSWCRAHDYAGAIDFGQVTGSTPTGSSLGGASPAPGGVRPVASQDGPSVAAALPGGAKGACTGSFCPAMVAITCTR